MSEEVDKLAREGKYKDAATVAEGGGEYSRAADLFEQIWEFAAAARCADLDNDLPRALSNALEAREKEMAAGFATRLQNRGEKGKEQALEVFTKRRHFAKAAKLAEELQRKGDAILFYQQGHMDLDASRLLIEEGREREAGKLLERVVKNLDAGPERSRANLQLGLLLASLMQHDAAVRCLQDAAKSDESRDRAQKGLVLELAALGLRDAARDILRDLHTREPSVNSDLDAYLRSNRKVKKKRERKKQARIVGGRYRIEEILGAGASGRVYRAQDQVTGRIVALKLLASSHSHGSDAYARFAREAKLATTLRHPNLVETYDVSAEQGYLIMELMQGASLAEKRGQGMKPNAIRRMCLDVLAGLELAHQRGIIHRDLKPANIFFDARGTAKIGDFGVAHLLDLGQTQTGGLIGTLAYMSPEQITGAPLTIAADLYGIGVTLYEILCDRLPFQGPDFVAQHLGEEAKPPSEVSDCDPQWDPILLRLLEKNPGDRYDSIDALRRQLTALDLSEQVGPLILPKAPRITSASSRSIPVSSPDSNDDDAREKEETKPRYAFETVLGKTEVSVLSRAIDTTLDRSVIIERFHEPLDEEREHRLFALARGGGPFLQRALSYDRAEGVTIFEAPTGAPLADLESPLSTRLAIRLFKRLARAVAPLHGNDRAHGGITGTTVLLDERGHPTVLVCGLDAPIASPSALEDTKQIMQVVVHSVGFPESKPELKPESKPELDSENDIPVANSIVDALLGEGSASARDELLAMPITDGEELYTFAEAIELVLLQQKQSAG